MLECYTTPAFRAAPTGRAGPMAVVTPISKRHPELPATTVTPLDGLSGDGAWLDLCTSDPWA
jgi:hypothetical protein